MKNIEIYKRFLEEKNIVYYEFDKEYVEDDFDNDDEERIQIHLPLQCGINPLINISFVQDTKVDILWVINLNTLSKDKRKDILELINKIHSKTFFFKLILGEETLYLQVSILIQDRDLVTELINFFIGKCTELLEQNYKSIMKIVWR